MSEPRRRHELRVIGQHASRASAFSYACAGCGRCCFEKRIVVSPFEIAKLAEALGTTTTQVIAEHTIEGGTVLAQRADGGCTFLADEKSGCRVHPGRPLVCRLYPLGRVVEPGRSESFVEVPGHPETEGTLGTDGTIGGWLEQQKAQTYIDGIGRYFTLFERLLRALRRRENAVSAFDAAAEGNAVDLDALAWLDIDGFLATRLEPGILPPATVEARVEAHLQLLEREIDALEA